MGNRDGGGHASPLGSGRAAAITMAHDTSVAVARRRGEIAGSGPWNQDPYPNGLGSFAVSQRFALYIAPPADDPLHAFAAGWLGWDPETGESPVPAGVAGIPPAQLAALPAAPRRYGLHGTLHPPSPLAGACHAGQDGRAAGWGR